MDNLYILTYWSVYYLILFLCMLIDCLKSNLSNMQLAIPALFLYFHEIYIFNFFIFNEFFFCTSKPGIFDRVVIYSTNLCLWIQRWIYLYLKHFKDRVSLILFYFSFDLSCRFLFLIFTITLISCVNMLLLLSLRLSA